VRQVYRQDIPMLGILEVEQHQRQVQVRVHQYRIVRQAQKQLLWLFPKHSQDQQTDVVLHVRGQRQPLSLSET
jgi:hypothetical protein